MTVHVLFLGEGTSDSGIVPQIEALAARMDVPVVITDPDLSRLSSPPGRATADKLRAAISIGGQYDLVIIHRDADRDGRAARLAEIEAAVRAIAPGASYAAVIPVRMTEAWLLTDEKELRQVAGNPRGTMPLGLPNATKVESVPDPKQKLKEALAVASGLSGRKLTKFHGRFSQHRRQLLERINTDGDIQMVPSWRCFVADVEDGLKSAAAKTTDR